MISYHILTSSQPVSFSIVFFLTVSSLIYLYMKLLSAISLTLSLMNLHNEVNVNDEKDNNDSRRTKVIAAISMAGIIVTAALLSGLLSFSGGSYPQAMAQQNMTGNTGATTGGGASVQSSACTPTQTGGGNQTAGGGMQGNTSSSGPANSSPSAGSLTGGITTGQDATAGGGVGTFGGSGGAGPSPGVGTTQGGQQQGGWRSTTRRWSRQ